MSKKTLQFKDESGRLVKGTIVASEANEDGTKTESVSYLDSATGRQRVAVFIVDTMSRTVVHWG